MSFEDPMLPADPALEAGMEPEEEPIPAIGRADMAQEADYRVKLTEQTRRNLGLWLARQIERFYETTQGRRDNAREWRAAADMYPGDPPPQSWQSNVRAPLTALACAQHTMRLNGQIIMDPPVSVVARTPEAVEHLAQIEEALAALIDESEWELVARRAHGILPMDCPLLVKVEWETVEENVPSFLTDWDEKAFEALVGAGLEPQRAHYESFQKDPDGRVAWEFGHQKRTVRDGVKFRIVRPEDAIFLPATAANEDDYWALGERLMLSGAELLQGAKSGRYDREAVDRLKGLGSDEVSDERQDALELQGFDSDSPGVDDGDFEFRAFCCYEVALKADLNGDGLREWYLLTLTDGGEVLRCHYLPYEHGQASYTLFPYLDRFGEPIGASVAERNASLQQAADTLLNCQLDLVQMASAQLGNFLYDERSGLDPASTVIEPGRPVRVQNVDRGIKPMDWARDMVAAIPAVGQALDMIKSYSELVTATSNPALGKETEGQKTLGEVQLVMSSASQIFGDHALGVALRWARVWDQVRWLYATYGAQDDEESGEPVVRYRKAAGPGSYEWKSIPTRILTAEVDLVPAGLKAFGDAQQKLQRAQFVNSVLQAHPMVMNNPAAPEVLLTVLDDLLQASGYPQREKVLQALRNGVMQQQMMMQQQALAAEEQAAMEQEAAQAQAGEESLDRDLARTQQAVGIEKELQALEQAALPAGAQGKKGT